MRAVVEGIVNCKKDKALVLIYISANVLAPPYPIIHHNISTFLFHVPSDVLPHYSYRKKHNI